jgi:hypothetical protein
MRITLLLITIIVLLYAMDVRVVVSALNGLAIYWNDATVYLTTFKDRHPWILLFMPLMVIILLISFRGDPDLA